MITMKNSFCFSQKMRDSLDYINNRKSDSKVSKHVKHKMSSTLQDKGKKELSIDVPSRSLAKKKYVTKRKVES